MLTAFSLRLMILPGVFTLGIYFFHSIDICFKDGGRFYACFFVYCNRVEKNCKLPIRRTFLRLLFCTFYKPKTFYFTKFCA